MFRGSRVVLLLVVVLAVVVVVVVVTVIVPRCDNDNGQDAENPRRCPAQGCDRGEGQVDQCQHGRRLADAAVLCYAEEAAGLYCGTEEAPPTNGRNGQFPCGGK